MSLSRRHLWLNPFKRDTGEAQVLNTWRATPLLRDVPAGVCEKLVALTHVRQYKPGEYVFREGESAVAAALIISGNVVIRSNDQEIARLDSGDFFGEAALLEDTPRSASAVADGVTRVSLLMRYQFEEFIRHRPQAGLEIMNNLAHLLLARLHRGNQDRNGSPS